MLLEPQPLLGQLIDMPPGIGYPTSLAKKTSGADVAQLAEQLICNQQVASSILAVSSVRGRKRCRLGRRPPVVAGDRWGGRVANGSRL
jgi:hypothetical protein